MNTEGVLKPLLKASEVVPGRFPLGRKANRNKHATPPGDDQRPAASGGRDYMAVFLISYMSLTGFKGMELI